MLVVEIDLFSGRVNPSWTVPEAQTRDLLQAIAANVDAFHSEPGPSRLGFRGLRVTVDDALASEFGVPSEFRVGDGLAQDIEASDTLARLILRDAPELDGLRNHALAQVGTHPFPDSTPEPTSAVVSDTDLATGQRDAWPQNAQTIQSTVCQVEVGQYNPVFWNADAWRTRNNCYAYGCNMRTNTFPQPGKYSKRKLQHTLLDVRECSILDGALYRQCPTVAAQPRWQMALVATPDNAVEWDYHWYRLGENGIWAHEPGQTLVTQYDQSGKIITDPETCDRGIYTQWGGYIYSNLWMNIS